jgi:hypothetical protein
MARQKQNIEEIFEKKENTLKEEVATKQKVLREIRGHLKKYQLALDLLRGKLPEKGKRRRESEVRSEIPIKEN